MYYGNPKTNCANMPDVLKPGSTADGFQFGLSFCKEGWSEADRKFLAKYLYQAKFKALVVSAILHDSSAMAFSGDESCNKDWVHSVPQPNFFDQSLVRFQCPQVYLSKYFRTLDP